MKLAFIGASHWHLPLYLDPALEVPGAQVVGISDPDPGFAAGLSRQGIMLQVRFSSVRIASN